MCGTVMRGATALPWSKTPLRTEGTRRNLGDLISPKSAMADPGHDGKPRRRSRRGRGEESDGRIVPRSLEQSRPRAAAEMVEGRRPAGGKASSNARPGLSTGTGMSPKLRACGSGCTAPKPRTSIASDLRQEPGAGKPHAGICAGGGSNPVPTATAEGKNLDFPSRSLDYASRLDFPSPWLGFSLEEFPPGPATSIGLTGLAIPRC